jgi:hypothetical protein
MRLEDGMAIPSRRRGWPPLTTLQVYGIGVAVKVFAISAGVAPMGQLQRNPETPSAASRQNHPRLRRRERTSLVKNRMREIRTSGSAQSAPPCGDHGAAKEDSWSWQARYLQRWKAGQSLRKQRHGGIIPTLPVPAGCGGTAKVPIQAGIVSLLELATLSSQTACLDRTQSLASSISGQASALTHPLISVGHKRIRQP